MSNLQKRKRKRKRKGEIERMCLALRRCYDNYIVLI
jgi:hypothetical protein